MTTPARPAASTSAARYASVNGLQLYYEIHGAGRPLVLLHGGLLTIDLNFGALIPALAAGRQVIGIELQGHGHTADTDRPMTVDILADDVIELLGQLGIGQADFLGFSLGGLVSLSIVLRHPALTGKLVIASADYRARPPAQQEARKVTRMPTKAEYREMRDAYQRVAPDPGHFPQILAKASAMVAAFQGWTAEDLRGIQAPTLLIFGDTDFIRLANAVEMFELIPNAQLAVLPGTTHVGVTKRPDLLLPLVQPFLGH
jgi:pimeloyl-ACP methyl ester carboxylesterase